MSVHNPMPSDTPIRVLLLAEQANPELVSVPLEGWSHGLAISKLDGVESHLLTAIRNRDAIERAGWHDGNEFTSIDATAVARPLSRLAKWIRGGNSKAWTVSTAARNLYYYYFVFEYILQ